MLDIKQIETFYPDSLKPFKRNILREYLQYKILEAVFDSSLAGETIHSNRHRTSEFSVFQRSIYSEQI